MTVTNKPIVAICYDFDKTLTPTDMQNQGVIQDLFGSPDSFWKQSNSFAKKEAMDQNLAWMLLIKKYAEEKKGSLVRADLEDYASRLTFFPGVQEWFDRVNQYGEQHGVEIQHYVISSGLEEMIKACAIGSSFKEIFASSYCYEEGRAIWPKQVVNYTLKTQCLYRIEKGCLSWMDPSVNNPISQEELYVPFQNMIYIGDSETDVPCMKVVNEKGGLSIAVFDPNSRDKRKAYQMMLDGRVGAFAPADYTPNSELDLLVKAAIDRACANDMLLKQWWNCSEEASQAMMKIAEKHETLVNAISALSKSWSFAETHQLIAIITPLLGCAKQEDYHQLISAARSNTQVYWIIGDDDVSALYERVLASLTEPDKDADSLQSYMTWIKEQSVKPNGDV